LHLRRVGPLRPERVIDLGIQVCGSLAEAHSKGMLHRDIKPDNLFLAHLSTGDSFVKILDFGIVKLMDASELGPSHLTGVGTIVGTPRYMAPEQILAHAVDERADLYSVGIVLYEALTLRNPFGENHDLDSSLRRMEAPPLPFERANPRVTVPRA